MFHSSLKKISQKTTNKQQDNDLHNLWQRIEKHQKRNANFTAKIASNFKQFEELALEFEQRQCQKLGEKIAHLVSFLPRKSLSGIEREELQQWIDDDLRYLSSHPFADKALVENIHNIVHSAFVSERETLAQNISADEVAALRESIEIEFEGDLNLTDEQIKDVILNPEKMVEHIDRLFAQHHHEQQEDEYEIDDEEMMDDDFFEEFYQHYQQSNDGASHEDSRSRHLDKLFKGSQLNKMYKRLASVLHPDKETDATKKDEKQRLMQELSQARRDKDGFSILQLYLAHFDDDPIFDQQTVDNLKPLLEQKISTLNQQYRDLQRSDDMPTLVWRKFKARNKTLIKQHMTEHADNLHHECLEIAEFIADCKTVKSLKTKLQSRLYHHNQNPFLDFEDMVELMFTDEL
ncbi:hypothetical protein ACMAZF_15780 [Psychrobium sp. nBUS_13]|uniref:hypothetical protein n=1 Tax=Psychrobium sp. nBUS_13 TaxID=3395319 RepID=UPI003EBCBC76